MLVLAAATHREFLWAQAVVAENHYLQKPVDPRSRPFAYVLRVAGERAGCMIFGRPEATRCYAGGLTYGSRADVATGRAAFDRLEVLNLARVWIDPRGQQGGEWCRPDLVPGFADRSGTWRPALASWAIRQALAAVGFDYLIAYPPVFVAEPYRVAAVLSYCDTRRHKGTIYRAAGFRLARRNDDGIETWWTPAVEPLTAEQDLAVRRRAATSPRGARVRAARAGSGETLF